MRADLLALTVDDLVVLGNRGIVKRAQSELDSGTFTYEIVEADDRVTIKWSDDVVCTVPAGKALTDGQCTCPATTLCRHLVRSVLAYQQGAHEKAAPVTTTPVASDPAPEAVAPTEDSSAAALDEPATAPLAAEPWDPGAITDEELARHLRKTDLARARAEYDAGQVIEVARSARPTAYFHNFACTLRFLVPNDLRYTHCECAGANPCQHVAEAVWAFRQVDPKRSAGTVSTSQAAQPAPLELLNELDSALSALAVDGVAHFGQALVDRFRRLESRCTESGLIWPAEIVAEVIQQLESYRSHDARFDPATLSQLCAELCIRGDAIRSNTRAVPQLFIRGSSADRMTDVGSARLVGLGCDVRARRGLTECSVYLQDASSGLVVAISQEFADPPDTSPDPPAEYWQLAARPALKGTSLAALGAGQLLLQGGKRTPGCRLLPGRARFSFTPQSFQWESLRAPALVDDFAELGMRLASAPPSSLRPRRLGANLHILAVASVAAAEYSEVDQTLYAALRDASDNQAILACPYADRAREGYDTLTARFLAAPASVRYVAGHVRQAGPTLIIKPVSVVVAEGGARVMLQPWVDRLGTAASSAATERPEAPDRTPDPVATYPDDLQAALGEQWLLGLRRTNDGAATAWRELRDRGGALGFDRLIRPLDRLVEALDRQRSSVRWTPDAAATTLLELGVLVHLARETAGASASG